MSSEDRLKRQIERSQMLQDLLLQRYLSKLEDGSLSDTGMGHLQKLLIESGWSLDPAKLPQELEGHLTSGLDPDESDGDEDDGVIPFAQARRR